MNTNKFDSKGTIYAKSRPNYPQVLFSYLLSEGIIVNNTVVADIGSGTGKFTTQIAPFVNSVFAVEPNDNMRTTAENTFKSFSNITSINSTAENTSLPSNSFDLITVAQAFHWFDRSAFKRECKRLLKADGKILLVWNDRDTTSAIVKDNFSVNKSFCPNFKGSSNGIDFSKESFMDFFVGEFETIEFDNALIYNRDAFVGRSLSSSYAPKENDSKYIEYIEALEAVFERHQVNGEVKYPYITRCYIGTV